jgi:LysM repeat protein
VPRGSSRYASLVASSARLNADASYRRAAPDRTKVARTLARAAKSTAVQVRDREKVIYHVKKGDTLGHIAEWFGCRAAELRNWNDIPYGDPIVPGRGLVVWVVKGSLSRYKDIDGLTFAQKQGTLAAQKSLAKAENGVETHYRVKGGDTLEKIAAEHGVSITQLKRWNRLRSTRINAGQELLVIADAKDARSPQAVDRRSGATPPVGTKVHVVRKGETLWTIAKANSVRIEDLKSWNGLRGNKVYAGQELKIYLNGRPVSKAG